MRPAYRYAARVIRVIDGDTLVSRIDLGFHVHIETRVRLLGWSCPELRDPLGPAAKVAAEQILGSGQIIIETEKDAQTFARWLARVWVGDRELGELLLQRGLAVRA